MSYGIRAQGVAPLEIGLRKQKRAPDLSGDLRRLLARQVACFYVEEDAAERGVEAGSLLDGMTPVPRAKLATLLAGYDQVHRW